MSELLIKHAINAVWCNPRQDNQMILKPPRLTTYGGAVRSWKFLWTSFNLPNNIEHFHIYSIGQIHPLLVNLFPLSNQWGKVSDSNIKTGTITEIYTQRGVRLPVTNAYYLFTEESSLLFAIPRDPKIDWDFNMEEIYIRLYDNAYFESSRNTSEGVYVTGGKMTSIQDIINIQTLYIQKKQLQGKVYCFVNGYRVKDINIMTVVIGDTVEFYHDPSVYQSYKFRLNELDTFDSILDLKRKYFLHTGPELGSNIYYHDDIDIYLLHKDSEMGVYFHKNSVDNLRMLTHKDYSISQPVVSSYLSQHGNILKYSDTVIELNVRKSGYQRPLIDEHTRIKELYKLPANSIPSAMIGIESSLDIWRVEELEKSNYTTLMRSSFEDVNSELVVQTYGYNAVVKTLAQPIIKTEQYSGQLVGILPVHYQANSTVYEYDTNGLYINHHYHSNGQVYNCSNNNAGYLFLTHGQGGNVLDEYYNVPFVTLDPNYDYRFYTAIKDDIHRETVWIDVTGSNQYTINGNIASWLNMATHDVLIRSNKKHLNKTFNVDPAGGAITFNLSHLQNVDGVMVDSVMQIPMGELKVFLNGRSLVRGLDYHVNFPVVTIVNKEYLINTNTTQQRIDYIFTGLCNSNLEFSTYAEKGFIRNGLLSVDSRFDIRDDKVNYIAANGRIYLNEDLKFVEDSHEFIFDSDLNGKPYFVEDVIVPTKGLTNIDTYVYKEESATIDRKVSDYLTLKMPKRPVPSINPITSYYKLYSPFISKVIFSLLDNAIDQEAIRSHYNDDKIRELVEPYLYLLPMDPIHVDNRPNMDYCIVHPHMLNNLIEVDIYQYRFINRVVNLYGNGLINLSGHLVMI